MEQLRNESSISAAKKSEKLREYIRFFRSRRKEIITQINELEERINEKERRKSSCNVAQSIYQSQIRRIKILQESTDIPMDKKNSDISQAISRMKAALVQYKSAALPPKKSEKSAGKPPRSCSKLENDQHNNSININPPGKNGGGLGGTSKIRTLYTISPIAECFSSFIKRFEAPRQPFLGHAEENISLLQMNPQFVANDSAKRELLAFYNGWEECVYKNGLIQYTDSDNIEFKSKVTVGNDKQPDEVEGKEKIETLSGSTKETSENFINILTKAGALSVSEGECIDKNQENTEESFQFYVFPHPGQDNHENLIFLHIFFDRNFTCRNFVMPPRQIRRVGLFATRTPHRFNPIGLSIGRLRAISKNFKYFLIEGLDVLNGTAVLAMTPYRDSLFDRSAAKAGWLDKNSSDSAKLLPLYYDSDKYSKGTNRKENFTDVHCYKIEFIDEGKRKLIEDKLTFIQNHSSIDIRKMMYNTLERTPILTKTHKKKQKGNLIAGEDSIIRSEMGIGVFRVLYDVHEDKKKVIIIDIIPALKHESALEIRGIDPESDSICTFYERFYTDERHKH